MSIYDESDKNDYFENSDVPERPKEPKKAKLTPDDPRYWDEPEDDFEHLKPSPRSRNQILIWTAVTAVVIGLLWAGYIRYFKAYISDATQYGYVEQIYKHGNVFNSYEGVLLPYKSLMDTVRPYEGDFVFSTTSSELAAQLKKMQFSNTPVKVTYKVYHTSTPWRGTSKIIVTAVDSVGHSDILPPDRQPEISKNNNQ